MNLSSLLIYLFVIIRYFLQKLLILPVYLDCFLTGIFPGVLVVKIQRMGLASYSLYVSDSFLFFCRQLLGRQAV